MEKMKRIIILISVIFCMASSVHAQDITLSKRNISLGQLFDEIKKQTGYDFLYNPKVLLKAKPVDVEAVKTPLKTVLDNCFANQPLTYTIDQRTIIVKEKQVTREGYSIISGRITNNDKKSVANASVFLNNGTIGGQTDTAGHFRLDNVKPGKYDLVVSIVGFETYHQTINISGDNISLPDIALVPKVIGLQEVVVKSHNDRYRASDMHRFTWQFLGSTYLADHCRILNPEVIDLDYDNATGTLHASTDNNFLVIDNDALGYRMRYLLEDFAYGTTGVKYNGSVFFQPMQGSPSQERRWAKKREQVYAASEMHFMRALINGKVENDGFRVLAYLQGGDTSSKQRVLSHIPMPCTALLHPTDLEGMYAFGTKYKALYVEYSPNHHFHENDRLEKLGNPGNSEASVISFLSPYLYFDQNGWVSNPNDVSLLGGWENYRVAGMLPADYEPGQSDVIQNRSIVADTSSLGKHLVKLKIVSDSLNEKNAAEKIYIQFDKPYYATGDTIWLKAYLLNAPTYFLSAKSGFLHVDIATDSNKVIKQYLFPVQEGLAWGKIGLDEADFKPGSYVIRAYTQWMQNFDNDVFYYKNIQVTGANEGSWLVNANVNSKENADKQNVTAKLQFTTTNKTAIANEPLQLRVMTGSKALFKQAVKTDHEGLLDVNFVLPEKSASVSLVAENAAKDKKATIPLIIDPGKNIDLQFLPEGGDLVAGFTTRIGFKAISGDGKGVNVSGIVTDQNGKQVAAFQSAHNGIGSFDLSAEKGAQYTAQIKLANGAKNTYALPVVKTSGTFLQVKDLSEDSLEVNVAATSDLAGAGYFLSGKARGVICYAAVVGFGKVNYVHSRIAKSLFPSGITHFVLMTPQGQPLNERLVYIDHHDNLHVDIRPDQATYSTKDSVALHIKVTDNDDKPLVSNFSLAVTDDSQVKTDSLNDDNILTRMLLTSDLKGYVEGPGYYFQDNKLAKQALDNLLLTQGWVSYEPMDVKMPYAAETEYKVSGRVNNVFNKGIKKADIVLLSKSPAILMDTVTDSKGRFMFNHFPRIDTPVFVIKTNNRDFNVNIDMDETVPPVFSAPKAPLLMPWYVNTDSTLMKFIKSSTQMNQQDYYPGGGRALKEVKITAKKTVNGSYNLNGPGNADVVLDEKQLENSGKKTFMQLLQENVKGFREYFPIGAIHPIYMVYTKPVILMVDGIVLKTLYNTFDMEQYLKFNNAEDVKGIEVNSSNKYAMYYMSKFFPLLPIDSFAFVEITTREQGPLIRNVPGLYLYKPLAISWPKQFYKPKYKVSDTTKIMDLRSTIDWEPNVSTDQNGEATVWFYAGSQPSTYSIIMQGVDGNGLLGYKRQKIVISPKETAKSK